LAARTRFGQFPFPEKLGRVHSSTPAHLLVWQATPRQSEPSFLCAIERKDSAMLGFAAAVIFLIAFVINATSTATSAVFSPMSLLLVGLICLALHLSGVGTAWSVPGRRTRR
jgi:predicted Co/Zn/Cd cation transporter (cation efflux family)